MQLDIHGYMIRYNINIAGHVTSKYNIQHCALYMYISSSGLRMTFSILTRHVSTLHKKIKDIVKFSRFFFVLFRELDLNFYI